MTVTLTIVLWVLAIGAVWYFVRYRKAKQQSNSKAGTPHARPTTDVVPLGPGITMFVPRSMSVDMPKVFGEGNNSYAIAIRELLTQTLGPFSQEELAKQDEVWEEWLDLNPRHREPRDLRDLLKDSVKDDFKARAFTILILPALRFSPFAWNDKTCLENYLWDVKLVDFSEKLRNFAIGLVRINVDFVLATKFNEKLYQTLCTYNDYILQILGILLEDDPRATELFDRYQINDPVGFSGMEDSSGYNPFRKIMNPTGYLITQNEPFADIPMRWKERADQKMRDIITAEQTGQAVPRYEWENALKCYMYFVQLGLYGKQLPYGADFFASQIEFALSLPNIANQHIIEGYQVHRILGILAGNERKDLRHRLARYVILENRGNDFGDFGIYNEETHAAAAAILKEFKEEDSELRDRIGELIVEALVRERENEQERAKEQTKVNSVLDKMK